jgi:hypothetical protein
VLPGPENPTPLIQTKTTANSEGSSAIFNKKFPLLFRYFSSDFLLYTLLLKITGNFLFIKSAGIGSRGSTVQARKILSHRAEIVCKWCFL